MSVKTNHNLAVPVIFAVFVFFAIFDANTEARADNPLSLTNLVKDVKDFTGKAVKGTAHGAEAVIKGTGNAVKNTAEGAGAVVRGTAHGAGALVEFSEKAVGITPADPAYHAPVAGAIKPATAAAGSAVTGSAVAKSAAPVAAVAAPAASKPANKFFNLPFGHSQAPIANAGNNVAAASTSLLGTSLDIVVDRHGNIIDSTGKLVGRVSVITSDVVGTPSEFAGQKLNVTVNGAGEMVDGNSRIIGHILGAEPPLIPKDLPVESSAIPNDLSGAISVPTTIIQGPATTPVTSPASSWTEEDVLKNTAPIMHGIN